MSPFIHRLLAFGIFLGMGNLSQMNECSGIDIQSCLKLVGLGVSTLYDIKMRDTDTAAGHGFFVVETT